MPRRPVSDPIVQHAIAQRARRKERRENRETVLRLLAEREIWALHELAEASELSREDCALAIDELRVRVLAELTEDGHVQLKGEGDMGEQQASFSGWARVEIMGHQTHIGFVRTEAYGQAVMFRVDAPQLPEREFALPEPAYVDGKWTPAGATVRRAAIEGASVLIGAASIYRIIPCTEAAALKATENEVRAELKLIALPKPETKALAGVAEPPRQHQPFEYDAESEEPSGFR